VVDGFVLLCVEGTGELLVRLTRERGLPFVALSLLVDDPDFPSISVDDRAGAQLAAKHLLDLGHRRLAILGIELSPDGGGLLTPEQARRGVYLTTLLRLKGYWDALEAAGISTENVPVFETRSNFASVEAGMVALYPGRDLGGDLRPTALLAMSDHVAMLAMDWLAARGLRVPNDVSVVGFDGVPDGARATPPLTTVAQPIDRIAAHAAAALLDDAATSGPLILPLTLVERASTGPAPRA
jgi:DNA-binding LacI/PurR family transcriptional regulator